LIQLFLFNTLKAGGSQFGEFLTGEQPPYVFRNIGSDWMKILFPENLNFDHEPGELRDADLVLSS
jgi:hypothetical protein